MAGLTIFAFRANGSDSDVAERARAMRVWRNADGLPSDSVTAIIQTRDGFLWVGTSSGLARFDGVKFTEVKLAMSATNHPARITALCEDSNGHLWIGTQEGGLFELEQGSVRHFAKGQGLLDDNIISLAAGERGLVWIGSRSGLNMWSGGHFQSFTTQEGLPDNFISGVNVARSGAVWITTRIGMCRYIEGHIAPYQFQTESQGRSPEYLGAYEDRRGNLWAFGDTYLINLTEGKRFNYFRSSESASVRIWSLCEGQDGRLWIGTSGRGLFCFDDNRFQPVTLGEDRLPYDVRALCEDNEANLWLGTSGGGLVQLRPRSVHILRAGQGLPASPPTALALEAGGRIYVGLERDGLFVGESGRFERVGGAEALVVRSFISFVCVDRVGTVWAGTLGNGLYGLRNGHGIHLTTANGLADDTVLAGCADAQGGIWISTGAGVVHRLTEKNLARLDNEQGLPGTPVTAMIPAAGGGIWLGTQDGQIFRGGDGKFTAVVITNKNDWHSVLALHEAEAGRLWIGTAGGGLSCLAGGIGMNWKVGNGLPSDVVAGVVEDSARNLWLATDAGIYRINHEEIRKSLDDVRVPLACQLMSYAKTGPNPTTIAGGRRAVVSPNGELWFATSDGLLDVDTRQPDSDPVTFPIYLESVAFNNQPAISLLQGALWSPAARDDRALKAPVDLRSLELRFTALTFAAPEGVRFRHKIEGFDPDWVDDADARSARYDGRLPYGHYRFRLAARKSGGKWREAAETFAFVVPTPLYFQTWAICLYGVTAIALITGTVRMVSHRRLRRAVAGTRTNAHCPGHAR